MSLSTSTLSIVHSWLCATIVERGKVHILPLGWFGTHFEKECILITPEGRTLLPPRITLYHEVSPSLLDPSLYTRILSPETEGVFSTSDLQALSDLTQVPSQTLHAQLTEYLQERLSSLCRGKRVEVFGLGDFYVTEEETEGLILHFLPSRDLLRTINRPFDSYQPVSLPDQTDFPDLTHLYGKKPQNDSDVIRHSICAREEKTNEDSDSLERSAKGNQPIVIQATNDSEQVESKERQKEYTLQRSPRLTKSIYLLLIPAFLAIWGGYAIWRNHTASHKKILSTEVVLHSDPEKTLKPDTLETLLSTRPSQRDRVKMEQGGSLNKFALSYYGHKEYWVYIYMANKEEIRNPNNIPVGTELIIPDLSYYQLQKDSLTALREARLWATVILSKKYTEYFQGRDEILELLKTVY